MLNSLMMTLLFAIMASPLMAQAESVKLKKHIPAPRCMVCNKGRACGDSCFTKKLALNLRPKPVA